MHDMVETIVFSEQLSIFVISGESEEQSEECLYCVRVLDMSQNLGTQPRHHVVRLTINQSSRRD